MTRAKADLSRVALQDQILARWGPEKIQELRTGLCAVYLFRELHGRPCHLLPITLDGYNCSYYTRDPAAAPGGGPNE